MKPQTALRKEQEAFAKQWLDKLKECAYEKVKSTYADKDIQTVDFCEMKASVLEAINSVRDMFHNARAEWSERFGNRSRCTDLWRVRSEDIVASACCAAECDMDDFHHCSIASLKLTAFAEAYQAANE